jgi:hypothetical protein
MKTKLLLLAACAGLTAGAIPAIAQTDVPLIARAKFFGNPSRAAGRLSPDGKWLSWLAPRDGVLNIWVAPRREPGRRPRDHRRDQAADPELFLEPGQPPDPLHQRQGRGREFPALRSRRHQRRAEGADPVREDPGADRQRLEPGEGPHPDRRQQPRSQVARRLQPRPRQRQADPGADEHGRLFELPRRRATERARRRQGAARRRQRFLPGRPPARSSRRRSSRSRSRTARPPTRSASPPTARSSTGSIRAAATPPP